MSFFGLLALSSASALAARQARVSRGEADPLISDQSKELARARARKLLGAQAAEGPPLVGLDCCGCGWELGELHDELAFAVGLDPARVEEEPVDRQQFLSDLIDIVLFGAPYEELDYGLPADWEQVAISGRRDGRRYRAVQRRAAKAQRQQQRQEARSGRQEDRQTRRGGRSGRRAQRQMAKTDRQGARQERRADRQSQRADARELRQSTRQDTRQARLDRKNVAAQSQVDAAVDAADAAAWEREEAADWAQADADDAWSAREEAEDDWWEDAADEPAPSPTPQPSPSETPEPMARDLEDAGHFEDLDDFEDDELDPNGGFDDDDFDDVNDFENADELELDDGFDDDDFEEAEEEADVEYDSGGADPEIAADAAAVAQVAVAAVGLARRLATSRREALERGEEPLVTEADVRRAKNRAFARVKDARTAYRARQEEDALEGDRAPRTGGKRPPEGSRPKGRGAVLHGDGPQGSASTPDVGGISLMDVGVDPSRRLRVHFLPVSLAEASELLVTLTKLNVAQLRDGARPVTQGIATGEIRYARPETATTLATLRDIWATGEADCAPLAAAYAAERTVAGHPSIPYLYYAQPRVIHAVVRDLRTGELFDPSVAAGMGQ